LQMDEELKGHRSDSCRRRILLVVGSELPSQAEVGNSEPIVPWVRGPHAGEDLGHGAKVLLHGPLANGATVRGKFARSDAVSEHLKERDWVLDAGNGWIEAQLGTKEAPLPPIGPISGRSARMHSRGNLVLAKAVDSACCCADVGWSIFQDVA
jgi:hypothetical protein